MRSDLLSKRIYYVGCFGLPWLWIVHVLFYWKLTRPGSSGIDNNNESSLTNSNDNSSNAINTNPTEGLLNPDDHFTDEPTSMTPEEIYIVAIKWVQRCKVSAIIVISVWVSWIIIAQTLRNKLPLSFYMLPPDSPLITGW